MRSFFEAKYPESSARGSYAPLFSDDRPTVAVLVAGAKQAVAIPTGAKYVSFASEDGQPFWAWYGDATTPLAIPSASGSTNTGEPNPAIRRLPDGVSHVVLIAATATKVALTFTA